MTYNKDNRLRVFTAFSGYDSQCMALDRVRDTFGQELFDYELVGWSEIDKYAIQAHNAIYPEAEQLNFGDISKIDWTLVPDFDLFTYSFPCTDISSAGQMKGFDENSGTRSSLLWECRKAIAAKRPMFCLMENVKALTFKKNIPGFRKWLDFMERQGYNNFYQIMDASDYGVAQHRERVFMVSIRDENARYYFPGKLPLDKCIDDYLEKDVDDSYFLAQDRVNALIENVITGKSIPSNKNAISKDTDNLMSDDDIVSKYKVSAKYDEILKAWTPFYKDGVDDVECMWTNESEDGAIKSAIEHIRLNVQ